MKILKRVKKISHEISSGKSLKSQIAVLKKINHELDRFVYSASHDLKAPLRSIMGVVQIAKTETVDDKQLKYLDMIFRSSMKLDNFINDLVNFSRNSRTEIKADKIDLNEILTDSLESISHIELYQNVNVKRQISEEPFYSDPSRIRIIFGNMVTNAFKYQDRTGKIKPYLEVRATITPARAVLVFSDNGEGIAKEHQKGIFKMFYRASERSQGSGLGLFIVKEVVKKLKGKIRLVSQLHKGSEFTVTIPNRLKKTKSK